MTDQLGNYENFEQRNPSADEDNLFSNLGKGINNEDFINNQSTAQQPQIESNFENTNLYVTNKDNSAIDLDGLGGQDPIGDDFEEYEDDSSLKIRDTTHQSDNIKHQLMMNLGGENQHLDQRVAVAIDLNNDEQTSRDSNLIIPLKPSQAPNGHSSNMIGSNLGFDAEDADGDAVAMELELLNNGGNPDQLAPMSKG